MLPSLNLSSPRNRTCFATSVVALFYLALLFFENKSYPNYFTGYFTLFRMESSITSSSTEKMAVRTTERKIERAQNFGEFSYNSIEVATSPEVIVQYHLFENNASLSFRNVLDHFSNPSSGKFQLD